MFEDLLEPNPWRLTGPDIGAAFERASAITFGEAPELSPEVRAIYVDRTAHLTRFNGLNLKDSRTRARAEALLTLDTKATYSRKNLDALCGQGKTPSSAALRKVFHMLPVPLDKRNGEGYEYHVYEDGLAELQELLQAL